MKIMWLSWPFKKLAKELNLPLIATGGWRDGLSESLTKYHSSECELILAFVNRFSDKTFRGKFNFGGG